MPNSRLSIAFGPFCTREWIAGCHYLTNLFVALKSLDQPPEIVLYFKSRPSDDTYRMLLPYVDREVTLSYVRPLSERLKFFVQRKTKFNLNVGSPIAYFLRQQNIDTIFMLAEQLGEWLTIPLLVWYPDFQHVHLPEMFSPQEVEARNQGVSLVAKTASRVILSSQDALHDFQALFPDFAHKGCVLPFVAQIPGNIYEKHPAWVCDEYHLPERFIYLPNQFWKHKNHMMAIEGLALAIAQRPAITVVCTGNTYDYRNPTYFSQDVLPLIANRDLHDHLIILGMIPREHVFALIRQSLAVLQPSRFEGWSSTIEETKSVGKQMILSDIPVHREQASLESHFFDPNDPEKLAECLIQIWDQTEAGPDLRLEAQAREQLPSRTRAFGKAFLDVASSALS